MERSAKIDKEYLPLTIFAKRCILDGSQSSKYAVAFADKNLMKIVIHIPVYGNEQTILPCILLFFIELNLIWRQNTPCIIFKFLDAASSFELFSTTQVLNLKTRPTRWEIYQKLKLMVRIQDILFREVYSEPSQTSKMELFAKRVNDWKLLTFFVKNSVLDVWQGSEYTSSVCSSMFFSS